MPFAISGIVLALVLLIAGYAWVNRSILKKSKDGKLIIVRGRESGAGEFIIKKYDPRWLGDHWRTVETILGPSKREARQAALSIIQKYDRGEVNYDLSPGQRQAIQDTLLKEAKRRTLTQVSESPEGEPNRRLGQ